MTNVYFEKENILFHMKIFYVTLLHTQIIFDCDWWLSIAKKRDLFPLDSFFLLLLSTHTQCYMRIRNRIFTLPLVRAHFFYCIKMQICKRREGREKKKTELVLCANFSLREKRAFCWKRNLSIVYVFFSSSHLVFINQTDFDLFE